MPGAVSEESVVGKSMEEIASEQHSQTGEALTEWRSSEQVENGTPSTSPPYWDIDDDEDCGPKPCQLYGKYTWKIDKFSQINKRELRGDTFEVGGYKWYILIYPQGCDVCNHLSLFLCVANHDKLLPGWSHFAQFTIAVVNKDPKKSKYSDTLHRFWKKEHDWGWKKFMELSKVLDGFIDSDTLTIKAQVQVLRERADRPFRCLDSQYRRELVRVYLTNVEQICRRFVEERRGKLVKLIEDKTRWSSFRAFWLGIDQNSKHCMSKEKADTILKVVVKHFFVEKEVTSTLVMDSLYSGLKALKGQSKSKSKALKEVTSTFKLLDAEEVPSPVVCMEKDMFVLVDDALQLLERAAMEQLPPKDDKGPQNRTKDGTPGEELIKDSIERDERRLTELGRRTVEIFVLAHIFSNKIEVAYQEAIALKRQEELIREEEAAWLAENGQKAKRGAADKEKKSKKKQAKQKRKNRKGKDKGKDNKPTVANQEDPQQYASVVGRKIRPLDKSNAPEIVSDISVSAERAAENFLPVSEDRNMAQACGNGSSGRSSAQNGMLEKRKPSVMDDSSSTCSTDSAPSVAVSGPCKGNGFFPGKNKKAPCRGKNQQERGMGNGSYYLGQRYCLSPEIATNSAHINDARKSCNPIESETEPDLSLQDRAKWFEEPTVKKEREVASSNRKLGVVAKPQVDSKSPSKQKAPPTPSSSRSSFAGPLVSPLPVKKASNITNKPRTTLSAAARKSTTQQVPSVTRPLSAPLVPGPTPAAPSASTAQVFPTLARSASATGRLGPDAPLPTRNNSDAPQSYKNAMMGGTPEAARDAVQDENQAAESPYSELKRSARSDIRSSDTHKRVGSDSVRQNVNALEDEYYEYPHLDMINDLLDGEDEFSPRSRSTSSSNGPRFLNRRLSFPEELGVPGDLCSCRLERTCYRDGFSVCYGSAGVHLGSFPPRYVNREIDGVDMNPWRMTGPDFSLFSRMVAPLESKVVDPYRVPEHWNIPCDLTGYPVF